MLPKWVLPIVCYYAIFGGVGYLFGQVFTGYYSLAATLAGAGGVIAASISWSSLHGTSLSTAPLRTVVVLSGGAALAGVALDAIEFYREPAVRGVDFSWHLKAPYIAALLFIAYGQRPLPMRWKRHDA